MNDLKSSQVTYCPVCNLWGVREDHAFNYHGVQQTYLSSTSNPNDTKKKRMTSFSQMAN